MLWSAKKIFHIHPFEREEELEKAINEIKDVLFGSSRIYLDMKKMIGQKGNTRNIPDGYLIDLSSAKDPKLYLVENELSKHHPLKHIAVQILSFSLSFETEPMLIKSILKEELLKYNNAWQMCSEYATNHGFDNLDYLLERMIYKKDSFNALVIIDELEDELETVLSNKLKFPVEVLTIQRFKSKDNEIIYKFEPFLSYLYEVSTSAKVSDNQKTNSVDFSEIDTLVVPAQEEGFYDTFIKLNCWYAVRIHSSMLPKIRYIAAYRIAPISAITHVAEVKSIEQWQDSNKYIIYFTSPAKEIPPIELVPKSIVKAPQSPRYTSYEKLMKAATLDEVF